MSSSLLSRLVSKLISYMLYNVSGLLLNKERALLRVLHVNKGIFQIRKSPVKKITLFHIELWLLLYLSISYRVRVEAWFNSRLMVSDERRVGC